MTITLNNVSFSYSPGVPVLRDISFTLKEGELILIVGKNGAGKSSLLKLLNGILKPTSGSIFVSGHDTVTTPTSELAKHVSVTFQNPADQIFASTVREEMEFGPRNIGRPDTDAIVEKTIRLFELGPLANKHPYDLLPAQRKLLTIAAAVAMGTPALALDEPTAGLSQMEKRTVRQMFSALLAEQKAFLIVSHDLEFFLSLATTVLLVVDGCIEFAGPPSQLMENDKLRRTGIRPPLALRMESMLTNSG